MTEDGVVRTQARMQTVLRRLRGILRTTMTACIPWILLGVIIGAVVQLDRGPELYVVFGRRVPGGLIGTCAIAGAFVGIVNGLTFSALVLATERGKHLDQLRGWRFGVWGGVATAAPLALLFQSPAIAALAAVVGAGGSLAALAVARRSRAVVVRSPIERT